MVKEDGTVSVKNQYGNVLSMKVPGILGTLHSGSPFRGLSLFASKEYGRTPFAYVQNMDSHDSLRTSPGPLQVSSRP